MGRLSAAVAIAALLGAACGGGQPGPSPTSPASSPTVAALEQPSQRCGAPSAPAETFRFQTSDGVSLDGAEVGAGPIGVVLAHQYPSNLCGWWPYANYLAKRGFRALLFDFRCFGMSGCPSGPGHWNLTADLQAASDRLRKDGATSVSLIGASLGAAAVLVAGSKVTPPPASVIELSGEPDLGMIGDPYQAGRAVRDLRVPVLFVVARGDPAVSVGQTRTMFEQTPSKDKQVMVLPSWAGHGWDLLTRGALQWSETASRVATFVRSHVSG